jgi:hypothetical protein
MCSCGAGVLASFVLWTWVSGNWMVGSLGYDYVPMAPSTAVLLMLFSAAVFLRVIRPGGRHTQSFAYSAAAVVFMACVFMCVRFVFSVYVPAAEACVSSLMTRISGVSLGLMAPLTLVMLQLTAVALVLELAPFNRSRFLRQTAPLLAMVVLLTTFLVVISYLVGTPLLYGAPRPWRCQRRCA